MTIVGFVSLVVGVVALIHYYLWRRLVRATTVAGRTRRVLTWVLAGLAVLVPVTLVGSRSQWGHFLAWPGFFWIAIMFYLSVFLVLLEIPRALALLALRRSDRRRAGARLAPRPADGQDRVARRPEPALTAPVSESAASVPGSGPARPSAGPGEGSESGAAAPAGGGPEEAIGRRLFITRTAAAVAGVGALATVGSGIRTALGDPVIESVKVALPRLDPRLSGLRFAVVSDIHLGPLTGVGHTQRIVRMINSLEADVVAIVGDLVDGTVAELGPLARPLKSLESRYGAYFVTGNHEYYAANGPQEWIEELRGLGVRPLGNERVEIAHRGAVLDLAGVKDINGTASGDGPDFERALGGRDRSRSTVLLAHQPVQAVQAAEYGVDLQLSGHTHGGQMVPFNLIVPLQQPVVSGLGEVDGTQVYVTRGAGFWGPPVRVGAPPEITLLELQG
ncbi:MULTISPECIES: metallophosphoesterase [Streptosporangium]|uniref:MPP superfamily phosphohydrolase n=1 Tax=Streptosporangium brasiliense TaxID=47480 RepID=A0ABT9R4R8_9ACTN|nr:metallophosphoesterase [Streptosporangium brasiliense]MDP9863887.1 putative MPP superfamily phosphohydrolase [Streptosporangium brasiliense]